MATHAEDNEHHEVPSRHGTLPKAFSGFLVVEFEKDYLPEYRQDFAAAAAEANRLQLLDWARRLGLPIRPAVTSVHPVRLRAFEQRAAARRGGAANSVSRFWRVDARESPQNLAEVEERVRRWPGVARVYKELGQGAPTGGQNPLEGMQGYRLPAPYGIDAAFANQQAGGRGEGTAFVDIERAWTLNHEDLPAPIPLLANDNYADSEYESGHGTSVLGIVAGVDNTKGTIGIAPKAASVSVASWWCEKTKGQKHVADALSAAALQLPHVVLVEVHLGGLCLPVESDPLAEIALRNAFDNDIVVVQAAGTASYPNVGIDLDLNHLQRAVRDTGTVMVGAANSAGANDRSLRSNFGTRVDCFAWGDGIVAPGFQPYSRHPETTYNLGFGGTSGAAAIIAGATLVIQGLRIAHTLPPLSAVAMRDLLTDPQLGTVQSGNATENIGVMPDLQKIFNSKKVFA